MMGFDINARRSHRDQVSDTDAAVTLAYAYVCMPVCVHARMYVCICVLCMRMCLYIYACIYIRKQTHVSPTALTAGDRW